MSALSLPWFLTVMKKHFSVAHTLARLSLFSGGHGVSFTPSGDDNYRASWRPVGRLSENPQPDVHHQCQEAHELWR